MRLRRIYDDPANDDGIRVLVDRRWPRGVSKARAELDEWCTQVAPSDTLRKWYGHDPAKFEEFGSRYRTSSTSQNGLRPCAICGSWPATTG